MTLNDPPKPWPPSHAVDTFIRLALLGGLLLWCVLILAPFTIILLWAVILAVGLYPLFTIISRRMGGRNASAATLIVLVRMICISVPGYFTGQSLVGSVQ